MLSDITPIFKIVGVLSKKIFLFICKYCVKSLQVGIFKHIFKDINVRLQVFIHLQLPINMLMPECFFFIGSSYVAGPDGSRTPVSEIVINIMQL